MNLYFRMCKPFMSGETIQLDALHFIPGNFLFDNYSSNEKFKIKNWSNIEKRVVEIKDFCDDSGRFIFDLSDLEKHKMTEKEIIDLIKQDNGNIFVDITAIPEKNIDSLIYGKNKDRIWICPLQAILENIIDHPFLECRFEYNDCFAKIDTNYIYGKEIVTLHNGWINFVYSPNSYYITRIQKGNAEQYIYLYTGNEYLIHNNNFKNILDVFYYNFEFQEGTYLINIFDKNFYNYNEKNISEYYEIVDEKLVITNKGISVNKISDEAISPYVVNDYCQFRRLPRPEIDKILSVFKPEFDIDESEQK